MREKKWVPNIYQPDDEAAIVKRLEKLAAKGWLLERAGAWGWSLRRVEPAQVRYALTYFPEASVFDPGPTEDQETYAGYCRAAGWEFITSYGPVQYFRSDLPDPVPIETDEWDKLESFQRTVLRKDSVLLYLWVLLSFVLSWSDLSLALQLNDFLILSDTNSLIYLAAFAVVTVCFVLVPADYLVWYLRSRRSLENGGSCRGPHTRFRRATSLLCVASGLVMLLVGVEVENVRQVVRALGEALLLLTPCAALYGFLRWMKGRGMERKVTRKRFVIGAFAVVAAMNLLGAALSSNTDAPPDRQPDQIYVDSDGDSHYLYADDLPVTLEDLGIQVTAADRCSYEREHSASFLVSYTLYEQSAKGEESELPRLLYGVAEFSAEWAAEAFLAYTIWDDGMWMFLPREEDAVEDPRWGADAVYFEPFHTAGGDWFFRYGSRLVHLRQDGDWAMTDERVALFREALSGQ